MSGFDWVAILALTASNVGLFMKTLAIRRQIRAGQQKCSYEEWLESR